MKYIDILPFVVFLLLAVLKEELIQFFNPHLVSDINKFREDTPPEYQPEFACPVALPEHP